MALICVFGEVVQGEQNGSARRLSNMDIVASIPHETFAAFAGDLFQSLDHLVRNDENLPLRLLIMLV